MSLSVEGSRFLILLVGIPIYICASATTPIAVALFLKGLSPGAALLLLLVGPATNASNILVLQKYIGKKGVIINIFSVICVGLAFSYLADYLYVDASKIDWIQNANGHEHQHFAWWERVMGIFLIYLIIKGIWVENIRPKFKSNGAGGDAHTHSH
jgi:hypothetical protein